MEDLKRGKNTPGLDGALDLVASFAEHPERADRYPAGTAFIAGDLPDAAELVRDAVREKRPFTVVYPDGSDWTARPPEGTKLALAIALAALFLLDLAARKKHVASDERLYVPRSWTVEYTRSAREPALTAS